MATVRIIVDDVFDEARIFTEWASDVADLLEATPGCRWKPRRNLWTIPNDNVSYVANDLRRLGLDVTIERYGEAPL